MSDIPCVFLSHSTHDKHIVRTIADALESYGLDVWLDEKRIRLGDSITDRIQSALVRCSYFLIVLSERSVDSPWVNDELRVAYQNRAKANCKILPVLLDACPIPAFLQDYLYLDMRREGSLDDACSQIVDAIVFDDDFEKYRQIFPGSVLVDKAEIDAFISGERCECAEFSERLKVSPIRKAEEHYKTLALDGTLESISAEPGSLQVNRKSKSTYQARLLWQSSAMPAVPFEIKYQYEIKNEFVYEMSWFYEINSPTRTLAFSFRFCDLAAPSSFRIEVYRSLGHIDTLEIEGNRGGRGVAYSGSIVHPTYRDEYKFVWS